MAYNDEDIMIIIPFNLHHIADFILVLAVLMYKKCMIKRYDNDWYKIYHEIDFLTIC